MRDRRWVPAAAAAVAAAALAVPAATASSTMLTGIYDEGATFFDDATQTFSRYRQLHVQVLRVNLYWGGKLGVAKVRPFDGADPRDAGYDWSLYDHVAAYAGAYGIKLLFSITGTPAVGERRSELEPPTVELRRPARLRLRGGGPLQRHLHRPRRAHHSGGPAVGGVERAEQPDLPPAPVRPQGREVGGPERDRLRQDLQRRLHRDPLDDVQGRAGRVRDHEPAREQQPAELTALRLADRLHGRGEEGRDEDVRRLRAQPVLRGADRDPRRRSRRPTRAAGRRRRSRWPTSTCS